MGKRLYDQWQQDVALERRLRAVAELEANGVQVDHREGVIVGLHFQNPERSSRVFQPGIFRWLRSSENSIILNCATQGSMTRIRQFYGHTPTSKSSVWRATRESLTKV